MCKSCLLVGLSTVSILVFLLIAILLDTIHFSSSFLYITYFTYISTKHFFFFFFGARPSKRADTSNLSRAFLHLPYSAAFLPFGDRTFHMIVNPILPSPFTPEYLEIPSKIPSTYKKASHIHTYLTLPCLTELNSLDFHSA